MSNKIVVAKAVTVKKILESLLGVALPTDTYVKAAIAKRESEISAQIFAPVLVAWDGKLTGLFATVRTEELESEIEILALPSLRGREILTRQNRERADSPATNPLPILLKQILPLPKGEGLKRVRRF